MRRYHTLLIDTVFSFKMNSISFQCQVDVILSTSQNGYGQKIGTILLTDLDANFAKLGAALHTKCLRRKVFQLVNNCYDYLGMPHQQVLYACPRLLTFSSVLPMDRKANNFPGVPLNLIFSPYSEPTFHKDSSVAVVKHKINLEVFRGKVRRSLSLKEEHLEIIYNGFPNLFEFNEQNVLILNFPQPTFNDQFANFSDLNTKLLLTLPLKSKKEQVVKFFSVIDPFLDIFHEPITKLVRLNQLTRVVGCTDVPFPFLKFDSKPLVSTEFWDTCTEYKKPLWDRDQWPRIEVPYQSPTAPVYSVSPPPSKFEVELSKFLKEIRKETNPPSTFTSL